MLLDTTESSEELLVQKERDRLMYIDQIDPNAGFGLRSPSGLLMSSDSSVVTLSFTSEQRMKSASSNFTEFLFLLAWAASPSETAACLKGTSHRRR
ncbi:hypothetical protein DNTS_008530 [Danionella cerebrum]|uniref:Uncharacterized protein n=1 Tax=Danionella cerebrum TaxID=2873325 RepID=A0A553RCR6_9TELE|nr:hypothetical protein DNTS_008530 [Danionella translucida]